MLKVASGLAGVGSLNYQGIWNASSNVPFLQSGVGTKGYYYLVSVAGTTNLDGITNWQVNDWAVFDGTRWEKVDNNNAVISVNGQTGVVNLTAANVGATPNTTYVLAGSGLSGGGQLNANVTITNAGVTSFNTRNGAVTLSGSDVSTALGYTPANAANVVTSVSATAPVASTGGQTPTISMSAANATTNGYLTFTDWNTFNNKGSGTVTSVSGTAPIVSSGGTTPAISIPVANATTNGYLSSTDWSTFNSKGSGSVTNVATGTGLTGGPITTTGTISLANTAVTAGTYGNASTVGSFTVDAQGRLTSASNAAISISVTAVSGAVPNTRNISTSTGLSGGGNLSADLTLSVTPNTTQQLVAVQNNGVAVGTRQVHNFIPGTNITIATSDDATNGRANITINTSGLGTMATQNANSVTITGGTINGVSLTLDSINNTPLGNITPSTANVTTLNASGNVVLGAYTGYVYANGSGANVTASTTIPNSGLANSTATLGNATITLGSTTSTVGNLTLNNVTINSGNVAVTYANAAYHIATGNIAANTNSGVFSYGNLSYSDTGIIASYANSANTYVQIVLQNTSNGSNASSDFVVTNDTGTAYADFGVTSSTFAGTGAFYKANTPYLYAGSSDLYIGTISNNAVHFVANNATTDAMVINANNTVTLTALAAGTSSSATFATASLPLVPAGYLTINLNGTNVKIPYYAV